MTPGLILLLFVGLCVTGIGLFYIWSAFIIIIHAIAARREGKIRQMYTRNSKMPIAPPTTKELLLVREIGKYAKEVGIPVSRVIESQLGGLAVIFETKTDHVSVWVHEGENEEFHLIYHQGKPVGGDGRSSSTILKTIPFSEVSRVVYIVCLLLDKDKILADGGK
jgi:hypothetical protein